MPKQRAVRSLTLSGLIVVTACSGCSLFISLDEIAPDNPGEGGAGTTVVTGDANASDDVSVVRDANVGDAVVRDANAGDAMGIGNADGGMTGIRPDATSVMPGSDGGGDGGACTNPMYPVSCPAMGSPADGGVAAGCWSAGTDCSSIRNCGGTPHGCSARYVFDCAANQCILSCNPTCSCTDPMFPVLCPGIGSLADGGTPTDCWTAGTDCSTVTNCNGDYHSCRTGFRYDCLTSRCVPSGDAGPRDGSIDGPQITCEGGLTACGARCVNLQTDVQSCGSCTNGCLGGNACLAGQCCAPPQAGGACNVPACGCAAGNVCYPDTEATGLQCFPNGGLADGADCSGRAPAACASGFGCFGGICAKYCNSAVDCMLVDQARSCVETQFASGNVIPGVSVCTRTCDPVTPQAPRLPLLACPSGFGCFPDTVSPGASDCTPQGGAGVSGSACTTSANCAPGYFCSTSSSTCVKWCSGSLDCTLGNTCALGSALGVAPLFAGTKEIGVCVVPAPP